VKSKYPPPPFIVRVTYDPHSWPRKKRFLPFSLPLVCYWVYVKFSSLYRRDRRFSLLQVRLAVWVVPYPPPLSLGAGTVRTTSCVPRRSTFLPFSFFLEIEVEGGSCVPLSQAIAMRRKPFSTLPPFFFFFSCEKIANVSFFFLRNVDYEPLSPSLSSAFFPFFPFSNSRI